MNSNCVALEPNTTVPESMLNLGSNAKSGLETVFRPLGHRNTPLKRGVESGDAGIHVSGPKGDWPKGWAEGI
jgi:hypothetical protein